MVKLKVFLQKINFKYRNTDLPDDIIFLSATFKGYKNNLEIEKYMKELKKKRNFSTYQT